MEKKKLAQVGMKYLRSVSLYFDDDIYELGKHAGINKLR